MPALWNNISQKNHYKHKKSDKSSPITREKTRSQICKVLYSSIDYEEHQNSEEHKNTEEEQQSKSEKKCILCGKLSKSLLDI